MRVQNTHARELATDVQSLGALLDALASDDDRLWPRANWPRMRLDRPLGVCATGGHGPIRYTVEEYQPGRRIRFRFTAPRGFNGYHEFSLAPCESGADIRHELVMQTSGCATLSWLLAFRPLHDALIEDALDKAELVATGRLANPAQWSWYVQGLRILMTRLAPFRHSSI